MSEQPLGFIHRFIPGTDATTLLLLHGTGGDENDLLPLGKEVAPNANLLSPRGKVLEDGMPRWFRRLAMGVFDIEDLKARTHELADFVEQAAEAYGLKRDGIIAVGFSNGANIAASMLLLRPKVLGASALLHAMVPFQPESLPDLSSTSALITAGRNDAMIPSDQAEALAKMLSEAGADVSLEWQPGGHQLSHAELEVLRNWLRQLEIAKRLD